MLRRIITIDEEKCNGCGLCAEACHEGAIGIIGGKAKLLREDYCDGLGDCLPACPMNAITFEEREALAYDEAAVLQAKRQKEASGEQGCPGTRAQMMNPCHAETAEVPSQLRQWPAQIKLVPIVAPFFDGADVLVAADCTAYAYGNFHSRFMQGKTTLIGCPKLDGVNYAEKLTMIFGKNDIKSVTLTRMQVPCCGGMENAVKNAIAASGKSIPLQVVTISVKGEILSVREF